MVGQDDMKYQAKVLSDRLRAICKHAINVEIVIVANEHKEQLFVRANYKISRIALVNCVQIAIPSLTEGLENKLAAMIADNVQTHEKHAHHAKPTACAKTHA